MSYRRNRRSVQSGPNQFTEYSYSGRRRGRSSMNGTTCGDALCLTVLGFVFIIGSIIVQFTTEQNYIARYHDIKRIESEVINMNDYNFFKKVRASDPVYITDTMHLSTDSEYPFDPSSSVKYKGFVMHKGIEMYSWIEKKSKRKEQSYDNEERRTVTTYQYIKQWSSKYHNHGHFRYPEDHYNPQNNEFMSSQNRNKYFWSTKIKMGKYYISNNIRSMLINDNSYSWNDITQNVYDKYYYHHNKYQWEMKNGYIYLSNINKYDDEGYEHEYGEPNIGDIRIKWTGLDLDGYSATFLGSILNSNYLNKYISKNKEEYIYLKVGRTDSIKDIIQSFHSDNSGTLWILRGVTLLFMMIGFVCCSSLVTYILSYIPLCGNLIGCTFNIIASIVGIIFWFIFFCIAYLSARKEVAIALIVAVILGLFFMQKKAEKMETKEGETKTD